MASDSPQGSSGFKVTDPPNPSWSYGEKVDASPAGREWSEGEKAGWKLVNPLEEAPRKLYDLMLSGIVPRPIAFVSTISADGATNLAPYSWFNQVSAFPPVISVSCTLGIDHTRTKDTVRNIRSTKSFTVNIISEPWIQQANICSVDSPEDFNEWPVSGLTPMSSIHTRAPRVKESALSMECELFQSIDIEDPMTAEITTTLVLGLVKYIHVRKDVLDENGNVDPGKLKPVARMGGTLYARVNEGFELPRYHWRQVERAAQHLAVVERAGGV
ncbi:putative flavin reductase like domain containing protein [Lyophyllum shimeji]|uniref:Flavin reductase like domain containing protein n=1 Tax=Lyophyllum shimeji TaxID=47721 RepID=A0A9P3PQ61_LYOSH|nr:putative flavin reductase like domain containing protein [Lyophyllum shimeji]